MPEVETTPYQRLSGGRLQGRDAIGRKHTLWLGPDHLLCVQDGGYTQEISRIDFADVQALILHPTPWFRWTNVLAAVPVVISLVLVFTGAFEWAIFGGILLAACLPILGINLALGHTCACQIQTQVQTKRLRAITRRRQAQRIVPVIAAAVRQAQANLPALEASLAAEPDTSPAPSDQPFSLAAKAFPARHPAHLVLFSLLAAHALLLFGLVQFFRPPMLVTCLVEGLLLMVSAILATVLQHRHPCADRVRVVTWITTVMVMLGWGAVYLLFIFYSVNRQLSDNVVRFDNQVGQMTADVIHDLTSEGLPGALRVALLTAAVVAGCLALAGFTTYAGAAPRALPTTPDQSPGPPPESPAGPA